MWSPQFFVVSIVVCFILVALAFFVASRTITIDEPQRSVVYRLGKFYRIAGPGTVMLGPLEAQKGTFEVLDRPHIFTIPNLYTYEIPFTYSVSVWMRFSPDTLFAENKNSLLNVVLLSESDRLEQVRILMHDAFAVELVQMRPAPKSQLPPFTVLEKLAFVLPGSTQADLLLKRVTARLQKDLRLLGYVLLIDRLPIVTDITLPDHLMDDFNRTRLLSLLNEHGYTIEKVHISSNQ